MPDTDDLVAHSTHRSADPGLWETMEVQFCSTAHIWLAQLLRGEGGTPPHPQRPPAPTQPTFPKPAVLHVNTADDVGQASSVRTFRGRLDLSGRSGPISVIVYVLGSGQALVPPKLLSRMSLFHPKIMPVLGYGTLVPGCLALVVPDPVGMDLQTYLRNHPDADKRRLIVQVAEGLDYLHNEKSVIYCHIEPRSVLVTDLGDLVLAHPWLTPLAFYYSEQRLSVSHASDNHQALPYLAPEVLLVEGNSRGKHRIKTRESDMYAFGMLVYEVFSGREPWAGATLVDIFRYIVSGQLLPRPEDGTIDDAMWSLCTACWHQNPAYRPGIANVLAGLRRETLPTHWRPDDVVGVDRWPRFQRPSLENATLTELAVDIDGSAVTMVIPKQKTITGAFGTVMKGYTFVGGTGRAYALKTCKTIMPREYEIWKSLSHRNILPLCGIVETNFRGSRERIFVSPYLERGNLTQCLKSDRFIKYMRLPLMIDVASGLEYLHDVKAIVHGDIKPDNILINGIGEAVLADFGFSTFVAPSRQETILEVRQVYTLTYCAPEVLDDTAEDPSAPGVIRSKTRMSDMYAYGVLLYQTYAGGLGQSRRDRIQLMLDMYDGRFPPRPVGQDPVLCDNLWSICERCWAKAPLQRPRIATVLAELIDLIYSRRRR